MRILLMGPPGVGKGTQAARLAGRSGAVHVSTGDILREAVQGGTAVGKRVREYVEGGKLVPDDLMGELIRERLGRPDAGRGFILDGFPRRVEQVRTLDRVLDRLGVSLDHAFILVAPTEEILRRLTGRRICPNCSAVYHLESNPPAAAGVCDTCGSALVQRTDDTEEVIRKRLEVYEDQTRPVLASYRERGLLTEIDGLGDLDAVSSRLAAELARA